MIHSPNLSGYACNFQRNFLFLNHKPTEIGLPNFVSNFTTLVDNKNNCPIVTGLNELKNINSITMSPNPFSIETTLHSDINLENASLSLIDFLGQTLKLINNIYGHNISIKREGLTKGLYIVKIEQNNTIIYTNKIMVVD